MAKNRHVSNRPSEQESGGKFTFPAGSIVTINAALYKRWEEAGENAIKGDRRPEDPALALTGEIEGSDEEPREIFLSAGKADRLEVSDDGEFLDKVEGNEDGRGLSDQCNAGIFLRNICSKKDHRKMAVPEELLDLGISKLAGLKFVAGATVTKREFDGEVKNTPSLIAQEILVLPKGGKRKAKDEDEAEEKAPKKKAAAEDEDEDKDEPEEAPARSKKAAKGDDAAAAATNGKLTKAAEKALKAALDQPKYRKGIEIDKIYIAAHAQVEDEDNADEICELANDPKFYEHEDRPWEYDEKEEKIVRA